MKSSLVVIDSGVLKAPERVGWVCSSMIIICKSILISLILVKRFYMCLQLKLPVVYRALKNCLRKFKF